MRPSGFPPATVIVPVKGDDEGLRENLAALASLDYPDYELIVVARTARDIPPGVLPPRVKVVLAHGADPNTGEKVQNLQAAVRAARKRSEIFAFADSDGRPACGWLRALAAPLAEKGVGASTGFRWFTPVPPTFWSLLRGVWDAVAAGTLGPGGQSLSPGAAPWRSARRPSSRCACRSTGRTRSATITRWRQAVHAAGLAIAWAPGALTPCLGPHRRDGVSALGAAPDDHYPRLPPAPLVAGAGGARFLLRGHGGLGDCVDPRQPPGRVGADRAAFPGHAERAQPRHRWPGPCCPNASPGFAATSGCTPSGFPWPPGCGSTALLSSAFGNTIEWRGYRYKLSRRRTV